MDPCPDDTRLAAFVEHDLGASDRDEIEQHIHNCKSCRETIAYAVAGREPTELEPQHGETIGRFALLDVLGIGGVGVVYAAYDPQLERKVAIKLLHASDGDDARKRLLREAQAMAKLDHPNVIKVHDVGSHDDQVYVAMELADAGTLRAWLAKRRTVREIVDVFVPAGRGLAAAHAAGLVHRDFKPDNVLMFKGGRVCVTDFGLVGIEAGNAPPLPRGESLTHTGAIMGTPLYMSPEQFGGRPATASSDQFSFCVALYEAVYGVHPFGGTTFDELAAAVALGKITPPPDAGRVPAWLRRLLLRGLGHAPVDRFPSMAALLGELARDRTRRRRQLLGGGLVAGALVAVGLSFAFRPASEVSCGGGEDHLAKVWNLTRRGQIEAAFLATHRAHAAETFAKLGPMIDDWGRTWTLGHRDACEATRVRGEQSEHALDLRMRCLDDRLDEVGATVEVMTAGGGAAVDRALDAAMHFPTVDVCARATAVAPPDTDVSAIKARVDEARAQLLLGSYAKAREIMTAALAAARATTYRPLIADALVVFGEAQLQLADRGATDSFREAIHLARAVGDPAIEVDASAGLVVALTTLSGKYEVALEIAQLADATSAHLPAELVVKLASARGDLDLARGKAAEARARYEATLARVEPELGPDHVAVLTTLERLGNVLKVQGKFADARKLYERVLATRERVEAPNHPDVASALNNLGNVSRAEGKLDDARRLYERALAIRIVSLGADHPAVADSYNNLGAFDAEHGDAAGARRYFDQAVALYERVDGADSVELAGAITNLGSALVVLGDLDAATASLERARKLYEGKVGPGDLHVGYVMSELGVIAERQGKLDEALAMIRRAEQIAVAAQGDDHPDVADYLEREVSVLTSQSKLAEAEPIAVRAIQLYQRTYGGGHPRVAMGLGALAGIQAKRADYKAALASWQQALTIFEAALPKDHPNLSFALAGIGDAMTELGRANEAMPYLERALELRTHAHMPPALIAEIHFYLGAALVLSPATRARAIAEVKTAVAMYEKAGDDDDVREMRTWLAKHR